MVRVGGDATLRSPTANAVFLAAGIGVSPILGLYREHATAAARGSAVFAYSATTSEELLFGELVKGGTVKVDVKDDALDFEFVKEKPRKSRPKKTPDSGEKEPALVEK